MLRLRLFGGFQAAHDHAPLPNLGPKLEQLLAYLTLHDGEAVRTARLHEALWPDRDSLNIVHQSLNRLRACLGPDALRLTQEGGAVRLDLEGADVDIIEFARLIQQGHSALRHAVELYRGPLLADIEGEWLLERREDLRLSYLDALKSLAEHEIRADNLLRAAHYLQRFVYGYPEMEWGWEALIQVHHRAGSRVKALETYRLYADYLCRHSARQNTLMHPSRRIETLIAQIRKEASSVAPASPLPPRSQQRSVPEAESTSDPLAAHPPEPDGGAVPLRSHYYIERAEDGLLRSTLAALNRGAVTLLIKGGRQIGKSSLLARALHQARAQGACVVCTDWQNLPHDALESAERLFLSLAREFVEQLHLDLDPDGAFHPDVPPATGFERFLRRQVFPAIEGDGPLVWAIDEADRLFPAPYRDDVFGKLRAWHNARAINPHPWERLSLILAYSTEANLFITNPNQSPFNVGMPLLLQDFTPEELRELNYRYGSPLREEELEHIRELIGGHPYLWRRCLNALQAGEGDLESLLARADGPHSLFRDHLERIRFALGLDPELLAALRAWLDRGTPPCEEAFARLCASGLMLGPAPEAMRARCRLYERYLRGHLP
jgi:DNA-binding SARP family transcriptional activator